MSEKKNSNLPATQEKRLKIISTDDRQQYLRLQMFQASQHRPPNAKKLKEKEVSKGRKVKYLPIGEIETMLDQDFFGLWSTENFTTKVVANEIVGEIELHLFHPVAQIWFKRIGAGGVQIQVKKDMPVLLENKIINTLEKDYPHLKTQCIRNAAQSLGAKYGRNLNRSDVSDYQGLMKDEEAEREKKHENLKS